MTPRTRTFVYLMITLVLLSVMFPAQAGDVAAWAGAIVLFVCLMLLLLGVAAYLFKWVLIMGFIARIFHVAKNKEDDAHRSRPLA